METFFQADFSGVRVHEGPAAPAMGALAFTLGEEIHFAPGLYDPGSREGVALLGHELTHVVQQRDERVANPYGHGVAIVQDPALEAEADRLGQWIADEMWSSVNVRYASYASGPPTPPHELAVPRPSPRRSWTAQRMQEPARAVNTNRDFTHKIPDLVLEIVNTKIDLDKAYQLKGGWEGWLQVEFALAAEAYSVTREEPVYTESKQRVDLYKSGRRNSVAIELKCESRGQRKTFDGKLLDDFLKLAKLGQHSYGVFVGVVTDATAGIFDLWIKEYADAIQVRSKVFNTENNNFRVVFLEAIARL